eukprot:1063592-Prymnesium_polylepis.1
MRQRQSARARSLSSGDGLRGRVRNGSIKPYEVPMYVSKRANCNRISIWAFTHFSSARPRPRLY